MESRLEQLLRENREAHGPRCVHDTVMHVRAPGVGCAGAWKRCECCDSSFCDASGVKTHCFLCSR